MWAHAAESPLLHVLEKMTGVPALRWKVVRGSRPTNGVQLTILALKAALENMTELSNEDWQHLDISGLHSRHYVETGGRLLSHDHDKESIKGEVVEDARGLKWTHMISRHYTISLQLSIRMVCSMVCTISFCIGVGRK